MYIKKLIKIIVVLGLVVGSIFTYKIYTTIFSANTKFQEKNTTIYIKTNATFADVVNQLSPFLKNKSSFITVAQKKGYANNVKAGKYIVKNGMNNNEIVNTLRSNNIPIKLSFNNQETLEKLAGRIASQIEADSISLLKIFKDDDFLATTNFTEDNRLAMYLPNTYEFFWNTSAETFRDRMLKEYNKFWNDTRLQKAKVLGLSKEEVITLASIVHKETVKVDERPRVAGVYVNRLKINQLLQADPTVIYAIKKHTRNYDTVIKRVLNKHLEIDSPYNTYKYSGLPPGPIAMADISAIDAVLNPEKHQYYYFVADVSNFGYHKFAKTLAQHNVNKQQYIRWINKQNLSK